MTWICAVDGTPDLGILGARRLELGGQGGPGSGARPAGVGLPSFHRKQFQRPRCSGVAGVRATPYTASVSTKVLAALIAVMLCATILVAASIIDDGDPKPAPATFDFCPPRLQARDAC